MPLDYSLIHAQQRKVVRGTPNPLDIATIISVFPREVRDFKPTVFPGNFLIKPGTPEKPTLTYIGSSYWVAGGLMEMPEIEVPHSGIVMADSIIKDYCNGLVGCNMGDKKPGLFCVNGSIEEKDIPKERLAQTIKFQENWFYDLVKIADVLWVRTNGNPTAVNEMNIMAAQQLGLKKPWMDKIVQQDLIKCMACQTLVGNLAIVCPNCKVVLDTKRWNEMKLQFAG